MTVVLVSLILAYSLLLLSDTKLQVLAKTKFHMWMEPCQGSVTYYR